MATRTTIIRRMLSLGLTTTTFKRSTVSRLVGAATKTTTTTASSTNEENKVRVSFLRSDGSRISVQSDPGKSLYDTVIENNVDIDGFGACEGTLCCTTCHLMFKEAEFEKVGAPEGEELDMLDLVYGLTDTSRLGCQVRLKKEMDPLEVLVPASISDVRGN